MNYIDLDINHDGFVKLSEMKEILETFSEAVELRVSASDAEIRRLRNELETERRLRFAMARR
ncbi:hypothetical protein SAMN04488056_12325 [Cohaesibacter marisflavi]|uniref:EF-hand domain-containing protein n=1 Tax=Cohaesibacter marisflavi TaxID=655353 RepID=A0A1I5MV31_9HYPH|nr:hypothetical protein [Cohaesibacter marisflavi]SFP12881.1 hypothetical protein SAMN04488056_12325 [Cohaesibacter marisflavi]